MRRTLLLAAGLLIVLGGLGSLALSHSGDDPTPSAAVPSTLERRLQDLEGRLYFLERLQGSWNEVRRTTSAGSAPPKDEVRWTFHADRASTRFEMSDEPTLAEYRYVRIDASKHPASITLVTVAADDSWYVLPGIVAAEHGRLKLALPERPLKLAPPADVEAFFAQDFTARPASFEAPPPGTVLYDLERVEPQR
jgi:uncharacterized protein (TIGR03067 family)